MDEGKRLFELLSDDNKRRALEGTLPSDFFSAEKMRQLNAWIESSGTTVESYFAEVETMSVREREVREAVAGVGLEYDEGASVEENAKRAGDVALESIRTGQPLPSGDTVSRERAPRTPRGLGATTRGTDAEGAGEIPAQRSPADIALEERIEAAEEITTPVTPVTPVTPSTTASAAEIREANQAEVERILAEQFGGFSFFLQKHNSELQVGLTADGRVVEADDPEAATVKNILDVIVEQGIVDPGLVRGLVQKTEWWQTTDARMREYDTLTADMSEPQKLEYLEPVLDLLREEAQYLGVDLDPQVARDLAEDITRMGEETDSEYIRGALINEAKFNFAEATMSEFAAQRDRIVALSKKYFTPIGADAAAEYAQEIYVGTKTLGQVEQIFRETIGNEMPQLQNALDAGVTPEQYFAPYKYEIERMLGRPNIDLQEEFPDVYQHIPEGGGQVRPMTLSELRRYVRGLPEWQQSTQGKDSARALAFAIGKTFGEVA